MGISAKQFEALQSRLKKPGSVSRSKLGVGVGVGVAEMEVVSGRLGEGAVILGVDPSLRGTGYGVVKVGAKPSALVYGTVKCEKTMDRSRCLARIHRELKEVIQVHRPVVCAVEGLFFAQNLQTALIMGEARGAALAAIAEAGLEIYEIAPRRVKQAMVGFGGAQKVAVAKMVQRFLGLEELPDADAADALALALTYSQETTRIQIGMTALKKV